MHSNNKSNDNSYNNKNINITNNTNNDDSLSPNQFGALDKILGGAPPYSITVNSTADLHVLIQETETFYFICRRQVAQSKQ